MIMCHIPFGMLSMIYYSIIRPDSHMLSNMTASCIRYRVVLRLAKVLDVHDADAGR